MEKIKPCPFCGGEAEVRPSYLASYSNPAPFYVRCMKCGATGNLYCATEQEAIEQWNRRAYYKDLKDGVIYTATIPQVQSVQSSCEKMEGKDSLRSCPFCGRMPIMEDCGDNSFFVKCKCGIVQDKLYHQRCDAKKAWNRRADDERTE